MLCESCKKRQATVIFKDVVGDVIKKYHLCEECAYDKGLSKPKIPEPSSPNDMFLHMAKDLSGGTKTEGRLRCTCGLTFSQFRTTGKLGCAECYSSFGEKLKPLFKRIHGATRHLGKIITKDAEYLRVRREILKLEDRLRRAVAKEDFEKAAKLRDEIKEYEKLKPGKESCSA
jgi:protein arginine kinase activator